MVRLESQPSAIRHIVCALDDPTWFATAEWTSVVEVWSRATQSRVSRFETVLDPGGHRLALISGQTPLVVAGAYHRYGICAYDATSGEVVWDRSDLKRVQAIEPLPERRVSAGFDERSLHVLSGDRGETLATIRGVERLYPKLARSALAAVERPGSAITTSRAETVSGKRICRPSRSCMRPSVPIQW